MADDVTHEIWHDAASPVEIDVLGKMAQPGDGPQLSEPTITKENGDAVDAAYGSVTLSNDKFYYTMGSRFTTTTWPGPSETIKLSFGIRDTYNSDHDDWSTRQTAALFLTIKQRPSAGSMTARPDKAVTGTEGVPTRLNVLANDIGEDGATLSLTAASWSSPATGGSGTSFGFDAGGIVTLDPGSHYDSLSSEATEIGTVTYGAKATKPGATDATATGTVSVKVVKGYVAVAKNLSFTVQSGAQSPVRLDVLQALRDAADAQPGDGPQINDPVLYLADGTTPAPADRGSIVFERTPNGDDHYRYYIGSKFTDPGWAGPSEILKAPYEIRDKYTDDANGYTTRRSATITITVEKAAAAATTLDEPAPAAMPSSADTGRLRLVPFEYSTSERYLLVLGDRKLWVYKVTDTGVAKQTLKARSASGTWAVPSGVTDGSLAAPWTSGQLGDLDWTQSLDTVIFAHRNTAPRRLVRSGADDRWRFHLLDVENDAWSDTHGWPSATYLYEGRLYLAATGRDPQTIWGSRTGQIFDFTLEDPDAPVDDDAVEAEMSTDRLSEIERIYALDALFLFTTGGVFVLDESPIKPDNFFFQRHSEVPAAAVHPVAIDNGVVFVRRASGGGHQTVYEIGYDDAVRRWRAVDLGYLAVTVIDEPRALAARLGNERDGTHHLFVVNDDGTTTISSGGFDGTKRSAGDGRPSPRIPARGAVRRLAWPTDRISVDK